MKWFPFLALVAGLSAQEPRLPALLGDILDRRPDLRLLDPSIDLPGGYTIDEIKDFGYWPPWVVVDLDHDKRPDVVATVVKATSQGTQFGVLAVHAQTPTTVRWIVQLGRRSLNGVAVDHPAADTVMPLLCIECDSNPWFRWNGRSYEPGLYAVGDTMLDRHVRSRPDTGYISPPHPKLENHREDRALHRSQGSADPRRVVQHAMVLRRSTALETIARMDTGFICRRKRVHRLRNSNRLRHNSRMEPSRPTIYCYPVTAARGSFGALDSHERIATFTRTEPV